MEHDTTEPFERWEWVNAAHLKAHAGAIKVLDEQGLKLRFADLDLTVTRFLNGWSAHCYLIADDARQVTRLAALGGRNLAETAEIAALNIIAGVLNHPQCMDGHRESLLRLLAKPLPIMPPFRA